MAATHAHRDAARRNIRKATEAAKRKRKITRLPKAVRRDLGRNAAAARKRGGAPVHALEDRTRPQLDELAKERDIPGRSKMGKAELFRGAPIPVSGVARPRAASVPSTDTVAAMRTPHEVEVTRPDKQLWPDEGITKRVYVDYLATVAEHALPWLRRRPLTLVRAPDGVTGERYFQKAVSSYAPSWIRRVTLPAPSAGRDVDYVVCDDAATLTWLGNQAALELHPAPVRVDRLERPDLLLLDIDPPDGGFAAAVEVALGTLDVLEDLGLAAGVKTTGGKGLHVVVPIERRVGATGLRHAAARLTDQIDERTPGAVTSAFKKADRAGRVMIDPSRNAPGATFIAPFSPRARAGAPVSFPVAREELRDVAPLDFTVATVPTLLDGPGPRAWVALVTAKQRLPASLAAEPAR